MSDEIQNPIPGTVGARFVGHEAPDEDGITQPLPAQFEINGDGPRQTPYDVQLHSMSDEELAKLSRMIKVENRSRVYRQIRQKKERCASTVWTSMIW